MSNDKTVVLPKWLQMVDGIATVSLSKPIEVSGVKVDTLTMREPTVKETRAATMQSNKDDEEMELNLFCTLASVTRSELEGLLMRDYRRLQAAYFRVGAEDGV